MHIYDLSKFLEKHNAIELSSRKLRELIDQDHVIRFKQRQESFSSGCQEISQGGLEFAQRQFDEIVDIASSVDDSNYYDVLAACILSAFEIEPEYEEE